MKERIKGRKNYPTEEIDSKNFLSDKKIRELVQKKDDFKFNEDDYYKLYNCVDCGECETEEERIQLKEKFIKDGNTFEGLMELRECFEKYRTPYPSKKMRIRRPDGIPEKSDTLFFMGCLSTIRIPRYTEHSLHYLLKQGIDFTILDEEICCGWRSFASGSMGEFEKCKNENIEIFTQFKKIICLCPACYFLFNRYYAPEMKNEVDFVYISDYLRPSEDRKEGKVGIQHLCQLINRGKEGVDKMVVKVLQKSGYEVEDIPMWCCGGGIGYMHRTDIIEAIARKRMEDFNKADTKYATTYCPSCWWILARFSKICKIEPKAKDIFELLM